MFGFFSPHSSGTDRSVQFFSGIFADECFCMEQRNNAYKRKSKKKQKEAEKEKNTENSSDDRMYLVSFFVFLAFSVSFCH